MARRDRERRNGKKRYSFAKEERREYRDQNNHTCARCGITQAQFNAENNSACSNCRAAGYQAAIGASMCRKCRESKKHHVFQLHHKIPQSVARKNNLDPKFVTSPENIALLCPTCHSAFHQEWDDVLHSLDFIEAIKKGQTPENARRIAFSALR